MENLQMQSLSRCNKRTGSYCPANYPILCTSYTAENANLGIFEAVENNGAAFAPKQSLYQKVAVGMKYLKMQSPSLCNKRTGRYWTANNPVSCTSFTAEHANFGIFEGVEIDGTAFAPKQYLYQKEAVVMENPKMQSRSRCNQRTGRYCPSNNTVSCTSYTAENANLGIFKAVEHNGAAFAPKQCIYQKVFVGMENSKMHSPSRCNKRTGRYCPSKYTVSCTSYTPRMQIW